MSAAPVLSLFLPCAGGVEALLADEVSRIGGADASGIASARGGVTLQGTPDTVMRLNLHSRLAQRVLVRLAHGPYRAEADLYALAQSVPWENWFGLRQSFKIELTAQHSPLKSLNFAALKIKDAVVDRFRDVLGERPNVETRWPDVRLYVHLTAEHATLYIDTSGEPLFKRGWREDKGEAPLKETLAAAMIAASGWTGETPLYDPCCGSGTLVIEAAQVAANIAPGLRRRFAFEKFVGFDPTDWNALKTIARQQEQTPTCGLFGSDVAFRMVDFAQRNAERAGVAAYVNFRGGDALQRLPPSDQPGVLLLNPPYGERIQAAGVAGAGRGGRATLKMPLGARADAHAPRGRESAQVEGDGEFFARLATHWKKHFAGWSACVLTPDLKLPTRMRLKESRRVPMWNGPIECRLFRFDMVAGSARGDAAAPSTPSTPAAPASRGKPATE